MTPHAANVPRNLRPCRETCDRVAKPATVPRNLRPSRETRDRPAKPALHPHPPAPNPRATLTLHGYTERMTALPASHPPAPASRPTPLGALPAALASLPHDIEVASAVLGTKSELAAWLGVARSQPTRWASRQTTPSLEVCEALTDLTFIVARARFVWADDVLGDWLRGSNAFLGGATPLELIRRGRTAEVLDAIAGESAGVYA